MYCNRNIIVVVALYSSRNFVKYGQYLQFIQHIHYLQYMQYIQYMQHTLYIQNIQYILGIQHMPYRARFVFAFLVALQTVAFPSPT